MKLMAALQNKYYTTEKNYEKKNLNSDGQQSHQYQQNEHPPLVWKSHDSICNRNTI
jgi:hypothetical protein